MSTYQVAIIFNAESDEDATTLANSISQGILSVQSASGITNAKISFVKFEKGAEEVAGE